jgi:hypothetical protein
MVTRRRSGGGVAARTRARSEPSIGGDYPPKKNGPGVAPGAKVSRQKTAR